MKKGKKGKRKKEDREKRRKSKKGKSKNRIKVFKPLSQNFLACCFLFGLFRLL